MVITAALLTGFTAAAPKPVAGTNGSAKVKVNINASEDNATITFDISGYDNDDKCSFDLEFNHSIDSIGNSWNCKLKKTSDETVHVTIDQNWGPNGTSAGFFFYGTNVADLDCDISNISPSSKDKKPTPTPTDKPTSTPTPLPTATSTPVPTATSAPTPMPTKAPTATPYVRPTAAPTATPATRPTQNTTQHTYYTAATTTTSTTTRATTTTTTTTTATTTTATTTAATTRGTSATTTTTQTSAATTTTTAATSVTTTIRSDDPTTTTTAATATTATEATTTTATSSDATTPLSDATTTTTTSKETKDTTTAASDESITQDTSETSEETTESTAPVVLPAADETLPSEPSVPTDPSDGGDDGTKSSAPSNIELNTHGGTKASGVNYWFAAVFALLLLLAGRYVYLNKVRKYPPAECFVRFIPGVPALMYKITGKNVGTSAVSVSTGPSTGKSGVTANGYNTASAMREIRDMEKAESGKTHTPKPPVKRPASASVNQAAAKGAAVAGSGGTVSPVSSAPKPPLKRPAALSVDQAAAKRRDADKDNNSQISSNMRPAKNTPLIQPEEDMTMDEKMALQKAEEARAAAEAAAQRAAAAMAAAEKAAAEAAEAQRAAREAERAAREEEAAVAAEENPVPDTKPVETAKPAPAAEDAKSQVKKPVQSVKPASSNKFAPIKPQQKEDGPVRPVWEKPQREVYSTPFIDQNKKSEQAPVKEQAAPTKPVWERDKSETAARPKSAPTMSSWQQSKKEAADPSKSQPKPPIPVWEKAKIKDPDSSRQQAPTKPVWEHAKKEDKVAAPAEPKAEEPKKPVWGLGKKAVPASSKPQAEPKIPVWEKAKIKQVDPDKAKEAPTKPVWEQEKKDTSYRASIGNFEHRKPDSDEMNALGSALVKDRVAPAASERKAPVRANWDNYARSGASPFKPIDQGPKENGGTVPGFAPAPGGTSATPAAAGSADKVRANMNTDEPTSFTSGSSRKAAFFSKAKHKQGGEPREETESAYGGIRRPNSASRPEEESSAPALGKALEGKRPSILNSSIPMKPQSPAEGEGGAKVSEG